MKLMTKELARKLPPIGATEKQKQPMAVVKFFTPWDRWTWYVTEFDQEEGLCFGLIAGLEVEYGYFTIGQLEEISGPFGLKIERDLYWTPTPVNEVYEQERGHGLQS